MSAGFNPYNEWLHVAGDGERPNHYQLLGLPAFAGDPEEINRAAQEKIRLVRTYQMGPQRAEALRVIGELSDAYACLSNPDSRRAYDQQLRQAATVVVERSETLSDTAVPTIPLAAATLPVPLVAHSQTADPLPAEAEVSAYASHGEAPEEADEESGSMLVWIVGGIAAVIGAGVLAIAFMLSGGPEVAKVEPPPSLPANTVANDDPNPPAETPEQLGAAQRIAESLTTGLIAHWKCDEYEGANVADSTGSYPGTIVGSPIWSPESPTASLVKRSLTFDGQTYVKTSLTRDLPIWSIAVWVKSPAAPRAMPSISSGPIHRENNLQISWNHLGPGTLGTTFMLQGNTWHYARFGELKANTWYHLAATYNGDVLSAYTNGKLAGANDQPSGPPEKEFSPLTLGKHSRGHAYFTGQIQDARVYERALLADEVSVLAGLGGSGRRVPDLAATVPAVVPVEVPTTVPPVIPAPSAGANGPAFMRAPFDKATAVAARQAWAAHLKQKAEVTNSIGMQLVLIPPGDFQMGAPAGETEALNGERPQHRVRISQPYYLCQFEVTRGQYSQFATETNARNQDWTNPGFAQGDVHPVVYVSWEDATRFCEWLSAKEGKTYRLPTEAEWEYACRAGTTSQYGHGADVAQLRDYAWFDANSNRATHTVGEKLANGFGLHDMHGNVWEWCADWHSETYYGHNKGILALDPQGPSKDSYRVRRGGSWSISAGSCRSACRDGWAPASRGGNLGFRVLRVPDGATTVPSAIPSVGTTVPAVPSVAPTPSGAASGPPPLRAPFSKETAGIAQRSWAARLKQQVEETNSIGMKLSLIPPGEFQMGSPAGGDPKAKSLAAEQPQRVVRITKPYYLGKFEVTRGQYEQFSTATRVVDLAWKSPGFFQDDSHPVVNVSWEDSSKFCEWLSAKESKKYRLPTEAEWEYACRAGTTTTYWHGDDESKLGDYAWFDANSSRSTHPVGEKTANGFGLLDVHGNVLEWCEDWYGDYRQIPKLLSDDPKGPPEGVKRVTRGGMWNYPAWNCRSGYRYEFPATYRYNFLGFRVVLVPSNPSDPESSPSTVSATPSAPIANAHSAVTPTQASGSWLSRHESFNARAKEGGIDLLFLGDSVTDAWRSSGKEAWAKYYGSRKAANMGLGGDRTQHVLWRLENGNIDGISPKLVVLLIGTNNSGSNTAEEIGDGITAIVKKLSAKLPQSKVLILGIFPRGEKPNPAREKNAQASEIASRLADGKQVFYLDIGKQFLREDGTLPKELMPDGLHLSPAGYAVWAESIERLVSHLLEDPK